MMQHFGPVVGVGGSAAALYKLTHLTADDLVAMNHTFDVLLSFAQTSADKLFAIAAPLVSHAH